jgi:hypothetical protein
MKPKQGEYIMVEPSLGRLGRACLQGLYQGNLTEQEGLGTVDLLIRVAGFVKKVNNVCNFKSR